MEYIIYLIGFGQLESIYLKIDIFSYHIGAIKFIFEFLVGS